MIFLNKYTSNTPFLLIKYIINMEKFSQNSLNSKTSFPSSKTPAKQSKPLPKPKILPKQEISPNSSSRSDSQVRLSDLCPEDKAKIGELVKRLALEKSHREDTEQKFEQEKFEKEKQMRKLEKKNEKIRLEIEEMRIKYNKSKEILDTYTQNAQNHISWNEFEKSQESPNFHSSNSINPTPEPVFNHYPSSLIKETACVSIQTVCDKEIQASEEDLVPSFSKYLEINTSKEIPASQAVNQIKNLNDDIFTLTESVKNFKKQSLRASQNLNSKKEEKISFEEEKFNNIMKRTDKNYKKAEVFRQESENLDIFNRNQIESIDFTPFQSQKKFISDTTTKKSSKVAEKDFVIIDKDFYDDNLFRLVDDLEKIEKEQSGFDEKFSNEELEQNSISSSSFRFSNSKIDESFDSFEELRARALKLKQTIKF